MTSRHTPKPIISRTGVYGVVVQNQKLLLVKQFKGPNRGKWGLPGGGIEPGETIQHALRRELFEEVGMEFNTMEVFTNLTAITEGIDEQGNPYDFHQVGLIYRIQGISPSHSHVAEMEYAWMDRAQLEVENISPLVHQILPFLQTEKRQLIEVHDYAVVRPFFTDLRINKPILHAIIEHKMAGKIWADDPSDPSFVLVYSPSSYVFLGGTPSREALQAIAAHLKTLPKVSLICPEDWAFRSFFEKAGFLPVERLQFVWLNRKLQQNAPCIRITPDNFEQCQWHSFMINCYGTAEGFYTHGMGFCLLGSGNQVISESYAVLAGKEAEIGVVTDERYRHQGLAFATCSTLLEYCEQNQITPYWSCDASNAASIALAKKLGFTQNLKYLFFK